MPTDFTLPELGENIAGGDVVRVLVAAGDSVKKDQPVLELETDKATIEVPSSVSGTVREVKIKQGERVKVGQVVLTLDNGAAPAAEHQEGGRVAGRRTGSGAGRRRGAASRRPNPSRSAARSSTSGAGRAARSPRSRSPTASRKGRRPLPRRPSAASRASSASTSGASRAAVRPGASARTTCRRYVRNALAGGIPASAPTSLPDFTKWGEVERKPMSNIRRKTAEHLTHAWNAIPHVTQHDKADITALEALRKQYSPQAEKAGGKLTMTAIALKIVARGAQEVPAVQLVDRHRAQRDRLQEVDPRRRRRRHRARAARAGDSRRRSQGHHRSSPPSSAPPPTRPGPGSSRSTTCRAAALRLPTSAASAARRSRRS